MKLRQIREGRVRLWVPREGMYEAAVFYNPAGELNRDISICAVQAFQKACGEKISVCDALSGTGVRGLRYAKEVRGIRKAVLNDSNPLAVRLIKRNIRENRLSRRCEPSYKDANILLSGSLSTVVDLDPFGTPILYLDSAARSVFWKGMLAVTATDLAPLCGTYPKACFRKYGILPFKADYYAELGMRILVSSIILACARHEKAFVPLLSHADQHYFRVYGRIEHGAEAADKLLARFGSVKHYATGKSAGPLYLGPIQDRPFCTAVLKDLEGRDFAMKEREKGLLRLLAGEAGMPPFYYDLHYVARQLKKPVPKMEAVLAGLRKKGFLAARTHFCPTAVKTDASFAELRRLFK